MWEAQVPFAVYENKMRRAAAEAAVSSGQEWHVVICSRNEEGMDYCSQHSRWKGRSWPCQASIGGKKITHLHISVDGEPSD